jgi:O-antigen ligase
VNPSASASLGRRWVLLSIGIASMAGLTIVLAGPASVLGLVVAALLVVTAARMPGILLAAYLLVPFYKGAVQPYSPVDITVVLAALNAIQIVPVLLDRHRSRHVAGTGILLWAAIGMLVVGGVLWAPDQGLALDHAASYVALVVLPLVPAALRVGSEPRHMHQFLWTLFAMGCLTAILGLVLLSGTDRLTVLGQNTIQVALIALLVPVLGATFVASEGSLPVRAFTIVAVPAALVTAVASGSRGPLLALVLLAGYGGVRYLLGSTPGRARRLAIVAAVTVGSILIFWVAVSSLPVISTHRYASLGDFIQLGLAGSATAAAGDTSSVARTQLFGAAVAMFQDQPLIGAGTSGFQAVSPQLLGYYAAYTAYPHNAVLQFAAEYGLVGVSLFVALILVAFSRRLPQNVAADATRWVLLYFLMEAMVSGDIISNRFAWGLVLLLLLMEAAPVARTRAAAVDRAERGSQASAPAISAPT